MCAESTCAAVKASSAAPRLRTRSTLTVPRKIEGNYLMMIIGELRHGPWLDPVRLSIRQPRVPITRVSENAMYAGSFDDPALLHPTIALFSRERQRESRGLIPRGPLCQTDEVI